MQESSLFEKMMHKVNDILNGMVSQKEYEIDWEDVVKEYLKYGIGDVPHFAYQFVFSRTLISKTKVSNEHKEAMYLEIINSINGELKKGTLPKNLEELKKYKEKLK